MTIDYFWGNIETLAALFDGDHATVESNLDAFEVHIAQLPPKKREEIKSQLSRVVSALARLTMRTVFLGLE
jgi:hypothetical protein